MRAEIVREASELLSEAGRYAFTRGQLHHELVRRGVRDVDADVEDLPELPGLIRPERHLAPVDERTLPPDVMHYAVRRVLVCDRVDVLLCLAMNGFYRRIEIAPITEDGFPLHVSSRLRAQLEEGIEPVLYTLHDCDETREARVRERSRALFPGRELAVEDVGLCPEQAEQLGVPLTGGRGPLEWLSPRRLLRWAYARVAAGHEDIGFG